MENHHLAVPFHEMQPVRSRGLSAKASLHDNLIVEGDNLAALKSLLPTYQGKVKCIYIDPLCLILVDLTMISRFQCSSRQALPGRRQTVG